MAKIKFNDVGEFLDEIGREKEHIDRSIVRVTQQTRRRNEATVELAVVATAIIASGDIVELVRPIGDMWGGESPQDRETMEKARWTAGVIEKFCIERNLEVRAGVFEVMGR